MNGLDYNMKALAIALYQSDNERSAKNKSFKVQSWALMNLAEVYYVLNKTDSALIYSQRAYELCISIKYPEFISFICLQLAKVHGKSVNESLAKSYYEMALI